MADEHEKRRRQLAIVEAGREKASDDDNAENAVAIAEWNKGIFDDYQAMYNDRPHVGEVFGFLQEARKQIRRRVL